MKKRITFSATLLVIGISVTSNYAATATNAIVRVYDGDTITLSSGERVRLLQIDTPELSPAKCYSEEARSALISLLSSPGQIALKTDPKLDKVDRYGRLLRYVFVGKTNINLKLVEIGAAAPYFYRGEKGQYSEKILKAAQKAKSKSIGLWKNCPGTQLAPTSAIATTNTSKIAAAVSASSETKCDPNYAGCIPVFPADVNCTEIQRMGLAPVKVVGQDIHKLDRDGDGIGCDK